MYEQCVVRTLTFCSNSTNLVVLFAFYKYGSVLGIGLYTKFSSLYCASEFQFSISLYIVLFALYTVFFQCLQGRPCFEILFKYFFAFDVIKRLSKC